MLEIVLPQRIYCFSSWAVAQETWVIAMGHRLVLGQQLEVLLLVEREVQHRPLEQEG